MSNKSKIEICANSVESAVKAQQAGAYRVELCAGIPEGGTTPSFGEIRMARQLLNQTKLHVIIRPRGGDFLYSPIEQEIMLHDIKVARQLGADGVVFGCLTAEGYVDVPMQQNEDNVQYVADQLRKLKDFIEECTGKKITDETLTERLRRSKRTLEKFAQYEKESADRYIPADLVTPLYAGMTNNLLLGTEEEETYVDRLLNDVKKAPAKKGKKIYWMHTIPFWSDAVKNELCFQEKAQIVGCELSRVCEPDFDPEKPYEAMARRMVYHALNGSAIRRIEAGIRHAKETGADGAVWFGHWGCKHTLGAAQLAKRKFEEQGIPLLILDGDGCDRSHGGEGQTSTRLGAFLEMLNTETDENTDRQEESHDE